MADKDSEFVQEYLYIEDYSLYYQPKITEEKKDKERGIVELDLDIGITFELD
jgi:hypothetical protein